MTSLNLAPISPITTSTEFLGRLHSARHLSVSPLPPERPPASTITVPDQLPVAQNSRSPMLRLGSSFSSRTGTVGCSTSVVNDPLVSVGYASLGVLFTHVTHTLYSLLFKECRVSESCGNIGPVIVKTARLPAPFSRSTQKLA